MRSRFGRFREGRLRLGRRQARRLAGKPAGNHSPGAIVAYRQPKAETRAAIIAYLKELN